MTNKFDHTSNFQVPQKRAVVDNHPRLTSLCGSSVLGTLNHSRPVP